MNIVDALYIITDLAEAQIVASPDDESKDLEALNQVYDLIMKLQIEAQV